MSRPPIIGVAVGDSYEWLEDGVGLTMTVDKVTKTRVRMVAPEGWTVTFHDWHKASKSPRLVKKEAIPSEGGGS